jgi:hypothetical protein
MYNFVRSEEAKSYWTEKQQINATKCPSTNWDAMTCYKRKEREEYLSPNTKW